MTTKINKPIRLTKALLETAKDMKDAGVLGKAAYEKITMRHLSLKDKNKLIEPLTGNTKLLSKKLLIFESLLGIMPGKSTFNETR